MWPANQALAVVSIIALGVGAQLTPRGTTSEAMTKQTLQLVGKWEKTTRSACSQMYPDHIEFQERGLYYGQKEPQGTFTQWDVGTYEIVDPTHVKISTANDAIISYEFSISNDVLKFEDLDGCEFKYRRPT